MSDMIERLRMLKEIAGIEGGCIGDAAADRIEELETLLSVKQETIKAREAEIRRAYRQNERLREAFAEKDDE